MVLRFVTKARMRKFETQLRNTVIELNLLRQRVSALEGEEVGEEDQFMPDINLEDIEED